MGMMGMHEKRAGMHQHDAGRLLVDCLGLRVGREMISCSSESFRVIVRHFASGAGAVGRAAGAGVGLWGQCRRRGGEPATGNCHGDDRGSLTLPPRRDFAYLCWTSAVLPTHPPERWRGDTPTPPAEGKALCTPRWADYESRADDQLPTYPTLHRRGRVVPWCGGHPHAPGRGQSPLHSPLGGLREPGGRSVSRYRLFVVRRGLSLSDGRGRFAR